MNDHLSSSEERSPTTSITIGFHGRISSSVAAAFPELVLEALLPETRSVVVDLSGVTACDDRVAAALTQVEAALIDDGCFLEVVGSRPHVAEVLFGAGLSHGQRGATPADLATIDGLLSGASGRVDKADTAARALLQLVGPDMCNVQILDRSDDSLKISTQHGFHETFLTHFARVADDNSACGAAMGRGELIAVDDVAKSRIFTGTTLDVMLEAGAQAVESMPYFDRKGELAGMISMHHRTPGIRPKREVMLLRLIAGRLGALWG
jgi:anti-anti-sigma regulatory factor